MFNYAVSLAIIFFSLLAVADQPKKPQAPAPAPALVTKSQVALDQRLSQLNATPQPTVADLKMPATITAAPDDGFVFIQAETKGQAQFTAIGIGNFKFKYTGGKSPNSLIVSVPPAGSTIIVTAVALVDGKMSPFATTTITTQGVATNGNTSNPVTPVVPKGTKLYVVTIGNDLDGFLASVTSSGHIYRNYSASDPSIASKNLTQYAKNLPALVVMDGTGKVLYHGSLPGTVDGAMSIVNGLVGK